MTADVLFKKETEEEKTNKLCYFLWLFFCLFLIVTHFTVIKILSWLTFSITQIRFHSCGTI